MGDPAGKTIVEDQVRRDEGDADDARGQAALHRLPAEDRPYVSHLHHLKRHRQGARLEEDREVPRLFQREVARDDSLPVVDGPCGTGATSTSPSRTMGSGLVLAYRAVSWANWAVASPVELDAHRGPAKLVVGQGGAPQLGAGKDGVACRDLETPAAPSSDGLDGLLLIVHTGKFDDDPAVALALDDRLGDSKALTRRSITACARSMTSPVDAHLGRLFGLQDHLDPALKVDGPTGSASYKAWPPRRRPPGDPQQASNPFPVAMPRLPFHAKGPLGVLSPGTRKCVLKSGIFPSKHYRHGLVPGVNLPSLSMTPCYSPGIPTAGWPR